MSNAKSFEEQAYEVPELWDPNWFSDLTHERFSNLGMLVPEHVDNLLDVGCGNGLFLSFLSKSRKWARLCGCDRSEQALSHVTVEKYRADISQLPFRTDEFDVVSCQEVLEHLPIATLEKALDELTRVAKQVIIISVPYAENLKANHNECPACSTRFHPDFHMNSFDDTRMKSLLLSRGFRVSKVQKLAPDSVSYHFAFMRLFRKKPFQNFTICPVCGFNRNETLKRELKRRSATQLVGSKAEAKKTLFDSVKRRIVPRYRTYRWIATVYLAVGRE